MKRVILFIICAPFIFSFSSCSFVDSVQQKYTKGVANSDLEMINEALAEGADINRINAGILKDRNPLWNLANGYSSSNQERLFAYLIFKGADVNARSKIGGFYLIEHYAWNVCVEECRLLIDNGAQHLDKGLLSLMGNPPRSTTEKQTLKILDMFIEKGMKYDLEYWKKLNSYDMGRKCNLELKKRVLQRILDAGYSSELTPVTEAALLGDFAKVAALMQNEYEIPEEEKLTLMDATAAFGTVKVMELLKKRGLYLEPPKTHLNPLMVAAFYGNLDMLKYLTQTVDVNEKSHDNRTALYYAFENGQGETAQYILDNGYRKDNFTSQIDTSDLYAVATQFDGVDMLEILLKNGYKFEDEYGNKDIHKAAVAIKWLGEDYYKEALDVFIRYGYFKDNTPEIPIIDFNLESIKYSIAHGADVNQVSTGDIYPVLYNKCKNGMDVESVRYLLEQGVNPNLTIGNDVNDFYNHPLYPSILYGNLDCINLLIEYGANVNILNIGNGSLPDTVGETFIMRSAQYGQENILRALIKGGANINTQSENGDTALIRAIKFGNKASAKILIEHGADTTLTDVNSKTALDYAKKYKMKEIITLLHKQQGEK